MSMITYTEAGKAVITHPHLTTLTQDNVGTNGRIALAILLDSNDEPECWCLFWEWGGDWSVFNDNDRNDAENLNPWMPEAVREAVAAAIAANPACEGDMAWFIEWADDAERALAAK